MRNFAGGRVQTAHMVVCFRASGLHKYLTNCSAAALADAYSAYRGSKMVLVLASADEKRMKRESGARRGYRACKRGDGQEECNR